MLKSSQYTLVASVVLVVLALACYILALAGKRAVRAEPTRVLVGAGGVGTEDEPDQPAAAAAPSVLVRYGVYFGRLATLLLTASLVFRAIATGHGPFANQYEFAVAFGWGVLVAFTYFEWRYRARTLALLVLPIAAALLLYAMTVGSTAVPLVPALQNNLLLSVHVAVAILAYGAFSVACATGTLYLLQPVLQGPRLAALASRLHLPGPDLLDEIGYRAVVIAFPLMTLTIILGAVWADIAWGTYWSWDPKETASLVTWLIYGAYLHARVVRGWRGQRAAWLLMAGFAAVLFTFFGNLFFGGLHSYSGVGPK